jgi:hypothetical protein
MDVRSAGPSAFPRGPFLGFALAALSAASAAAGTITGQVSNAATKSYLEGAIVEVAGTSQRATTDREGRYHLDVTGDTATLVVSFSGLDTRHALVVVRKWVV